jgi:hypothetical protein
LFIGSVFALVTVLAQVGPETAMTNLGAWADYLGIHAPPWLFNPTTDKIATAIGIAGALIGFTAAYFTSKQTRATKDTGSSLDEPKPTHMLPDGRIIVGVTPQYVSNVYKDNNSLRAGKLTANYISKWIELSGPFGDVTSPSWSSNPRMAVTFAFRRENTGSLIIMYFDANRWQKYLEVLVKNQEICVRGQITKISNMHIELDNCEFINPQTDEVIESEPEE